MKKMLSWNMLILLASLVLVLWLYRPDAEKPGITSVGGENHILAVNWQPAFCEGNENRPECRSQHTGRFDTENFSLHGLWSASGSQVYCNVPLTVINTDKKGRWRQLPKLDLPPPLRNELVRKMPGYQSYLHRHEWFKHGSCMDEMTPEKYYRISLALLDQVNASPLVDMFRAHLGKPLAAEKISGVSGNIRISCKQDGPRRLITELLVYVTGNLNEQVSLQQLSQNVPLQKTGCAKGIVDPAGYQ